MPSDPRLCICLLGYLFDLINDSRRVETYSSFVVLMVVVICFLRSSTIQKNYDTCEFENLNGWTGYLNRISEAREQEVLLKTLQFQLRNAKAEDEQLVAFVESLIHQPFPASERNLSDKTRTDFSQSGQSKYIDGLLGSRRDGFFCGSRWF